MDSVLQPINTHGLLHRSSKFKCFATRICAHELNTRMYMNVGNVYYMPTIYMCCTGCMDLITRIPLRIHCFYYRNVSENLMKEILLFIYTDKFLWWFHQFAGITNWNTLSRSWTWLSLIICSYKFVLCINKKKFFWFKNTYICTDMPIFYDVCIWYVCL